MLSFLAKCVDCLASVVCVPSRYIITKVIDGEMNKYLSPQRAFPWYVWLWVWSLLILALFITFLAIPCLLWERYREKPVVAIYSPSFRNYNDSATSPPVNWKKEGF